MISINKFINDTRGQRVDVPWANGAYKGQCVSLLQQYISQCLGQPMKPYGNAKDWDENYVGAGLGKIVGGTPQRGDIIVYNAPYGGGYGHIQLSLGGTSAYDQNNTTHDGGAAGLTSTFGTFTIIRPNAKAPEDLPPKPAIKWIPMDRPRVMMFSKDMGKFSFDSETVVDVCKATDARMFLQKTTYKDKLYLRTEWSIKNNQNAGFLYDDLQEVPIYLSDMYRRG